ncbi:MAG: polyprenyl synthetase family protein [Halobacteriota archaeon]|nr:polyprenyl synthetase family protein [Halobacteriota archaeon]
MENIIAKLQERYAKEIEEKIYGYLDLVGKFPQLKIPLVDFFERGGKRFRPIMCLLSCELVGGDIEKALPVAASIEMFHNFSLIHDDIEDRGDLRRNKLAIHLSPLGDALSDMSHCPYCNSITKSPDEADSVLKSMGVEKDDLSEPYGLSHAINSGDALMILSLIAANDIHSSGVEEKRAIKAFETLIFGVLNVCVGQGRDIDSYEKIFSKNELSEEEVLKTLRLKTGSLIAAGCKASAIIGGATDEEVDNLGKFCEYISLAFQLQDDILNIDIREDAYGKEVGGDIEEGKRTVITVHALGELGEYDRELLLEILDKRNNTEEEKMVAIEILRKSGAIDYAKEFENDLLKKAKDCLGIFPDSQARSDLLKLADFLVGRGY